MCWAASVSGQVEAWKGRNLLEALGDHFLLEALDQSGARLDLGRTFLQLHRDCCLHTARSEVIEDSAPESLCSGPLKTAHTQKPGRDGIVWTPEGITSSWKPWISSGQDRM